MITTTITTLDQLKKNDLADLAQSRCDECGGAGQIKILADERRFYPDQTHLTCSCRAHFQRRIEDAEFPDRFADSTLGDLEWDLIQPDKASESIRAYVNNLDAYLTEHFGALLLGMVGCGKTHLAIGIAKLASALGRSAMFVNVPVWLQAMRESYSSDRHSVEGDWMADMRNTDVLVLDDLGAEKPSDWMRERLYLVVNHRSLSRRVNLVTSNLTIEELETCVGERTLDRLYADAVMFKLEGVSYRRRQKETRLARVTRMSHT